MTTVRALLGAALVLGAFTLATAKLPAPPPMTDEQKAAAEEKKAKDATAADVAKKQQAAEQKAKGNVVTPQMAPAANVPAGQPAKAPEPAQAKK